MTDDPVLLELAPPRATLTLNRPAVRNAFDDRCIARFHELLGDVERTADVRVLVLAASGKAFCAGADLTWMRRMRGYTFDENVADARALAALLERLDAFPLPTVGRIQGDVFGGGTGLVAALDVAVAVDRARFALTEVRLGLAPAVISPFLLRRMGPGPCRRLFLTGEQFSAPDALRFGLVDVVAPEVGLDQAVEDVVANLLQGAPCAQRRCKELVRAVPGLAGPDAAEYTARTIAELRAAPEAQERMTAFLQRMEKGGGKS